MRSSLSALLVLPLIAYGQSDFPKCSSNAREPAWSLQEITFHSKEYWATPDHGVGSGEVSFSLASNTREFVASCNGTTSQVPPLFKGDQWYSCDMPDAAPPANQAWFTFNYMGRIQINETYTCWEDAGPTLVRYTAFGEGHATLNCVTDQKTNPRWKEEGGPYYKRTEDCSPASTKVTASEITGVA